MDFIFKSSSLLQLMDHRLQSHGMWVVSLYVARHKLCSVWQLPSLSQISSSLFAPVNSVGSPPLVLGSTNRKESTQHSENCQAHITLTQCQLLIMQTSLADLGKPQHHPLHHWQYSDKETCPQVKEWRFL